MLYGEMHRYLTVVAHWLGYRVAEVPVEHHPRMAGESKYGLARFWRGFADLVTDPLPAQLREPALAPVRRRSGMVSFAARRRSLLGYLTVGQDRRPADRRPAAADRRACCW